MNGVVLPTDEELRTISLEEMDRRIRAFQSQFILTPDEKYQLKMQRRRVANRIYARESRQFKREELEYLERQNILLRKKISSLEEENEKLRQRRQDYTNPLFL